ncbi:hypothetical protein H7J87_29180 [Mycolicibacterium wolinskyi]|uniref:Uncharacterized protein n=1 Tax=Mycolicibacterium wolinskyi TaxID=59750 RepID=A0A1X2FK15_9MYCO|nr:MULTISPECIES: hypothetical protein [Mycolicibacterium]MCV7289408.1 hypothetical protein [Mycolicibacterium wolinskyi]MCV7297401.1 hypothetical protein [Mycolicibacterium goodii]ORX18774.1 hypothetical protein AWC31_12370 [Mycolicibacterium wolinskyi]
MPTNTYTAPTNPADPHHTAITEDDPAEVPRDRARVLLAGRGADWDNPLGVARALTVAATLLDLM